MQLKLCPFCGELPYLEFCQRCEMLNVAERDQLELELREFGCRRER